MAEFVMPQLGADMSAGTLVCWRKAVGDGVRRGDIIAEVETEKGNIDVEVFTSGKIEKFLVGPGQKVPVGTVLALIRENGESKGASISATPPGAPPAAIVVPHLTKTPVAAPRPPSAPGPRLAISPSARRLARELRVDPARLTGTGHGGAITREDIERAAATTSAKEEQPTSKIPSPAEDRSARIRQTIAAAMSRSKREIPHYYLSTTIDMHRSLAWLSDENSRRPIAERILYGALLLKAAALALHDVPELNASWTDGRVDLKPQIHVGVAIALRQGGLVAPALHDTDQLTLGDLMNKLRDLVNRTRAGSLRSSELSDPTITVTSLGEQGVECVYGVIYPPQVAMIGIGKIVERPWCIGGQVVPRSVVTVTLAADHRVSDGHRGGLFLAALDRLLQEPSKL